MVTYGSDIELFFNKDGKSISSMHLFPNHERIETNVGLVERDGYAVELQPMYDTDIRVLADNTKTLLVALHAKMQEQGLEFSTEHIVKVDIPKLIAENDDDSMVFGCKPDLSAYTLNVNTKPDARQIDARTAGGHIHIGIPEVKMRSVLFQGFDFYKPADKTSEKLITNTLHWMDILIGLRSVIIDKPSNRREVYGKAGDFRYTAFGCEYRSLSNFFLMSRDLFLWTFRQAEKAVKLRTMSPGVYFNTDFFNDVQNAINTCNRDMAMKLCFVMSQEMNDLPELIPNTFPTLPQALDVNNW